MCKPKYELGENVMYKGEYAYVTAKFLTEDRPPSITYVVRTAFGNLISAKEEELHGM